MFIYKITNQINNKVYIGQTSSTLARRWANHRYYLRKGTHFNEHLQRAWIKYGEDSFLFERIAAAESLEELNRKEQEFIRNYKSIDPIYGYNKSYGGGVFEITIETRNKISKALLGNKHTLGHKQSPEQIEAKRKAMTGKKLRPRTAEEKVHLSQLWSGEKSKFWGKPSPTRRKVYCETNGKTYDCIQDAAAELNCDRSSISAVCRGKMKSLKGLVFRYID